MDERLNWAIVTPGGGGAQTTTIVDLGHNPQPAATWSHTRRWWPAWRFRTREWASTAKLIRCCSRLRAAGNLTSFSLLDNTVNSITFMNNGVALHQLGFSAAAADPLENIGIAVNSIGSTAAIVDLESGNVLQTVSGLGLSPQAVAVDPVSNLAVVANQGSNPRRWSSSLEDAINPLQIVQASPAVTFASARR